MNMEANDLHFSKQQNARPPDRFSMEFVYTRDSQSSDQSWECMPRKCSKILSIVTGPSAMSVDWCVFDRRLPLKK